MYLKKVMDGMVEEEDYGELLPGILNLQFQDKFKLFKFPNKCHKYLTHILLKI